MRQKFAVTMAALSGILLLVLNACNTLPLDWFDTGRDGGRPTRAKIGALAPEIDLLTLAGERIVLSQQVGKPVIINFWATWCGPCRAEFPALVRKFKQYQAQGLVILAINTQDPNSDEGVRAFAENTLVPFAILRDRDERVANAYNIRGLPTSVFIDRQGIIREIVVGAMDDAYIARQFEKIK